ncbi:transglycosylase domain-containing protein [Actinomadura barringtoniae]|nr:transglycosylase domain-containing protein [Actinomadura barringtoniae]
MNTPVPTEKQATAVAQESVIYYDNGTTPIARVGMKRESVPLAKIPDQVQKAVLAAEDRGFEHEPGVSPTGIARALFKTATGGDVQGGSTITQQLSRNYFAGLSQDRTVSRKLKEILISVRLGQEMKKQEILNLYLNTVYFGREAYGVQAAARAYFHKDVSKLKVNEAAMLAAMIQRPNYFKTTGSPSYPAKAALISRWNYVLNGMVESKWLDAGARAQQKFPTTQKTWSDVPDTTQAGYMTERVKKELESLGIDDQALQSQGYRVYTTFNRELQDYTAKVVNKVRNEKHLSKDVRFGLASVNTKGEVVAAYGGPGYDKQQWDDAFQSAVQPGSSFKPVVLAAALKKDISLKTTINGSYRRVINEQPFTNDSRSENGVYNLLQMTQHSINTAYVDLGQKVGLDDVVKMGEEMGIPHSTPGFNSKITSLPLGPMDVSPVNMASVYSTFAAEGKHTPVHVITKITDSKGKPVKNLPWDDDAKQVFSKGVAGDATKAMQAVVQSGTGTQAKLDDGRQVAGKTGTASENKSAWFVGYTPQLAVSAAMWREKNGKRLPLQGVGGYNQIYGGTVPSELFKLFMTKAMEKEQQKDFPPPGDVGSIPDWAAPKPTPTPTPSTTPTCQPGQQPTEPGAGQTQQPCPSTTPSPTPSTPSAPPSSSGQPCDQFGMPVGCNPNIPPSTPPPAWWCNRNPDNAQCKPNTDPGRSREPNSGKGTG